LQPLFVVSHWLVFMFEVIVIVARGNHLPPTFPRAAKHAIALTSTVIPFVASDLGFVRDAIERTFREVMTYC
jgi:hypothetical protein